MIISGVAPPALYVFVITDQPTANDILDLITGRQAAALATVTSETAALVAQAEGISTAAPAKGT